MAVAHGGGIPEALSLLAPIALAVVLLRLGAKRRLDADAATDAADPAGPDPADPYADPPYADDTDADDTDADDPYGESPDGGGPPAGGVSR